MDNTIILTGSFTSTGSSVMIPVRSDLDWCYVYNYTQASTTQATGRGVQFYWQRGMAAGTGLEWKKTNSTDALNMVGLVTGGFTLFDTSEPLLGPLLPVTSIDVGQPPQVTVGSTAALTDFDTVRLYDITGAQQFGGIDFTVDVTAGTTFQLEYAKAIAAATTGFYRKVFYNPLFRPSNRYITKVTQAANAVVSFSVTHTYTIGQKLRFSVPQVTALAYGMTQLNGLVGTVVATGAADADGDTNTVTVDIDTSAFTAFAFPLTADVPFTPASVSPLGENTATANANLLTPLGDAIYNNGSIGLELAGGAQSPAGSLSDLIYVRGGKSFSNEGPI